MNTAIKEYARQETVIKSFADILGERQANAYISSVLIAVANSTKLQECSPVSIISSAMRAATLSLSCDPGMGQAYLVPFKGKCTLIIGYRGLMDLALRTGKYRYLNVSRIYEGEEIIENRLTGMHSMSGNKKSSTVIGYLLYFELMTGFSKTVYMTVEEIIEHARRYSKSFDEPGAPWKTEFDKMAKKTILRQGLTHWGYFDPSIAHIINQVDEIPSDELAIDETVDAEYVEPEQAEERQYSEAEIMSDLGF